MPSQKRNAGTKVFVDSSVLFAAVLSPGGGSFRIFREARERNIELIVSHYVMDEVRNALEEKRSDMLGNVKPLLVHFPIRIIRNPQKQTIKKYYDILPPEDAPILAAAISSKSGYLLTLDKKHFLIPLQAAKLPLEVLSPGAFIQRYFD